MRDRLFLLVLSVAMAASTMGCGDDDTGGEPDAGGGGVDAGGVQEVPAESVEALRALTRGVGTSAALAGPLLAEGSSLRDDGRLDMPGGRDMAVQERVENGVSGDSIVTDPTCTMFTWNLLELSVAIAFEGCVLESTGEPLDGNITLDVDLGPTEFILTFDALTVADLGLDGEVGLRVGGACRPDTMMCSVCPEGPAGAECREMQLNQQTLWADINFQLGTDVNVVLENVELDHDATGTTVGGTGTIGSPGFSGSFTSSAVKWNMMECLPSSGTVIYQPTGGSPITVEFQPTTPDDGFVMVQLAPLPPFPYELFEPCAAM